MSLWPHRLQYNLCALHTQSLLLGLLWTRNKLPAKYSNIFFRNRSCLRKTSKMAYEQAIRLGEIHAIIFSIVLSLIQTKQNIIDLWANLLSCISPPIVRLMVINSNSKPNNKTLEKKCPICCAFWNSYLTYSTHTATPEMYGVCQKTALDKCVKSTVTAEKY